MAKKRKMIRIKIPNDVVDAKTYRANVKKCSKCKKEKELSEFYTCKTGRLNVTSRCKPCAIKHAREYKEKPLYPKQHKLISKKETPYHIKLQGDLYIEKQENIKKLRNVIDALFLDHECGILRNNEIIINDEDKEYTEEKIINYSDSLSKYMGSGLGVLGVKKHVLEGDFVYKCSGCDSIMVYTEYNGKRNFNFRVSDNLRIDVGYCNKCESQRQIKNREKPLYRLSMNYRSRTSTAFRLGGYKKGTKTEKMLGIDFNSLKQYLENQFTEGMSWDNYGKWHIDHIIPTSSANTKEELITLCHHKNLQPLWAFDNLSKNGKYNEKEKAEMIKTIINCKQYQKQ